MRCTRIPTGNEQHVPGNVLPDIVRQCTNNAPPTLCWTFDFQTFKESRTRGRAPSRVCGFCVREVEFLRGMFVNSRRGTHDCIVTSWGWGVRERNYITLTHNVQHPTNVRCSRSVGQKTRWVNWPVAQGRRRSRIS